MRSPLTGLLSLVFPTGLLSLVFLAGCSPSGHGTDASFDGPGGPGGTDGAAAASDAATSSDGTPMRTACTKVLANKIGQSFGRLDGYLTAITAPGTSPCFADRDHVHLLVTTTDGSYDIAVNVNDTSGPAVEFRTLDAALPDGAWSEGWHNGDALDYVQLGVHSADFAPVPAAQLASMIASELASANHISVFAKPYTDGTGAHDVHRNSGGNDGALVVRPTDATAHLLLFHFQSQVF